jgi:hypothetical protein
MKSLRQSAIFWTGVFGLIFLLWLWGATFQWRTEATISRGTKKEPVKVLLNMGVLDIQWSEVPAWYPAGAPAEPFAIDCWLMASTRRIWASWVWYPDPYIRTSRSISISSGSSPGGPVTHRGMIHEQRVQIPLWMLVTLHVGFFWSLLAIRRRRMARKWLAGLSAAGEEG